MQRTHTCGELTEKNIDEVVTLCGWVHTRRDHGGLIFVDLWDKYGLTQIVLNPQIDQLAHQEAHSLRGNFVISVSLAFFFIEHRISHVYIGRTFNW